MNAIETKISQTWSSGILDEIHRQTQELQQGGQLAHKGALRIFSAIEKRRQFLDTNPEEDVVETSNRIPALLPSRDGTLTPAMIALRKHKLNKRWLPIFKDFPDGKYLIGWKRKSSSRKFRTKGGEVSERILKTPQLIEPAKKPEKKKRKTAPKKLITNEPVSLTATAPVAVTTEGIRTRTRTPQAL